MTFQRNDFAALRELTPHEAGLVAGGNLPPMPGDSVTFWDNDGDGRLSKGDTIVSYTTSEGTNYTPEAYGQLVDAQTNEFTQIGLAYWGIGAGFSFGENGEIGIFAGIGFIPAGVHYQTGEYADGTQEGININWPGVPNITVDTGDIRADSEPYVWNPTSQQYEVQPQP